MTPKTTRLAFLPEIGTGAGKPLCAHPEERGGKRRRSVSSSARITLRVGKLCICRKICLFFLFVGICRQYVTEALPNIAQTMQLLTKCTLRYNQTGLMMKVFLKKRSRPSRCWIAKGLGR